MGGPAPEAAFAFVTVEPGFERAVKVEVARDLPDWRFAYGRRGLLTFKVPDVPSVAPSSFARVWGRSLGRANTLEAVLERVGGGERSWHVVPSDPQDAAACEDAARWRENLRLAGGRVNEVATSGEEIVDVVVDAPGSVLVGRHRHGPWRSPEPGGTISVEELEDAPSRAWAKVEEAVRWGGIELRRGETVLDIGAAPGGGMAALLRRGLHVWAIDPGALDLGIGRFAAESGAQWRHLQRPLAEVRWEDLTTSFDWIVCDVHLAPQVALHQLTRILPPLRERLRGAIITLKLNDWAFLNQLPDLRARIVQMGFVEVHTTHLPANRQELCAVALTGRGR